MVAHSSSAFACLPARRGSAKKTVKTRLTTTIQRRAECKGVSRSCELARYRPSSQRRWSLPRPSSRIYRAACVQTR